MEANIRITCILFERVRAEGTHPTLADSFIIQQTVNGKKSIQKIKNTETGN